MGKAIAITGEWTASALRRLAGASRHANQSRRLLSLAAVLDGMNRTEAARIGGMDRQTPRDRVHRFNEQRRAFATKEYSWPAGRVAHLTPA